MQCTVLKELEEWPLAIIIWTDHRIDSPLNRSHISWKALVVLLCKLDNSLVLYLHCCILTITVNSVEYRTILRHCITTTSTFGLFNQSCFLKLSPQSRTFQDWCSRFCIDWTANQITDVTDTSVAGQEHKHVSEIYRCSDNQTLCLVSSSRMLVKSCPRSGDDMICSFSFIQASSSSTSS